MLSFPALPLLLSLLLCLPFSSVLSCREGSYKKCLRAPFVPGHNLVGEGFDVVTLKHTGAYLVDVRNYLHRKNSCILCRNHLQGNKLQRLPVTVTDWRAVTRCDTALVDSAYSSVSKMVNSFAAEEGTKWKIGLNLEKFVSAGLQVGGTRSDVLKFATERLKEDRYSFSTHQVTCKHYSFRVSHKPRLSLDFRRALARLPKFYNSSTKAEYTDLLHTYGTHYIRQVSLGGRLRRVTATRSCLSSLMGFSSHEKVHKCLSLGFSIGLGQGNPLLSANFDSCSRILQNTASSALHSSSLHQHHTSVVGGTGWLGEFSLTHNDSTGFTKWLSTLKDHPDIVSYQLRPMYMLVPNLGQREGLKAATEQYLEDNAVKLKESDCGHGSGCCPKQVSIGTVEVTIIRAWGLKGDWWGMGRTEAYVKLWCGPHYRQTHMVKSNDPWWNSYYHFPQMDASSQLYMELWDEDINRHQLLGRCWRHFTQGTHRSSCGLQHGGFEIQYTLTCDPHLTGAQCENYKPSPE